MREYDRLAHAGTRRLLGTRTELSTAFHSLEWRINSEVGCLNQFSNAFQALIWFSKGGGEADPGTHGLSISWFPAPGLRG